MAAANDDGSRQVSLSRLERLHVQQALKAYNKSLERSKNNEIAGSDVSRYREADMALVGQILLRLA